MRDEARESLEAITQHLAAQASLPIAVFESTKVASAGSITTIRANFLQMQRVSIGAGAVGPDDIQFESLEEANWLVDVMSRAVSHQFGPVLYVGQSADLRQRIQQHLSGASGLRGRLQDCGLTMHDVALYFLEMPPHASESIRMRLELLLTHLTGAPLSRRPG